MSAQMDDSKGELSMSRKRNQCYQKDRCTNCAATLLLQLNLAQQPIMKLSKNIIIFITNIIIIISTTTYTAKKK